MNNANYILVCLDADGKEVFVGGVNNVRYKFYIRKTAVTAMEKALECISRVQCTKLYRRHRSGGYRWVATRFRDGSHLSAWGE